jgi:hypothetical protein
MPEGGGCGPQVSPRRHFHGRAGNPRPWLVDDAPRPFVTGQLRAIVGVEVVISRIEAKAKLGQNRPGADIDGVIAGLRTRGDDRSAAAVAGVKPYRAGATYRSEDRRRDCRDLPGRRSARLASSPWGTVGYPGMTARSGTQRARSGRRITRVFSCVARGFKARPSFMFAGCCWWRSLAVDGSSGASRGHARNA